MFYLASRSHSKYLKKLLEISSLTTGHHILSITGGLAFIHGLGPSTLSLHLVDCDPDVNDYAAAMLEVIRLCPSRNEFFSLLSGYVTRRDDTDQICFVHELYDSRTELMRQLSPNAAYYLERFYKPATFNFVNNTMFAEEMTIHFTDFSLQAMHFNWLSNFGVFSSEHSYQAMRLALIRLNVELTTCTLESCNFDNFQKPLYVLASNTDSPLFTKNDIVLRKVLQSTNHPVFYVSRTRDWSQSQINEQPIETQKFTESAIAVNFPDNPRPAFVNYLGQRWQFISWSEYEQNLFYDLECLAVYIDDQNNNISPKQILHKLEQNNPIHQRVLLVTIQHTDFEQIESAILAFYNRTEQFKQENYLYTVYTLKHRIPYSF